MTPPQEIITVCECMYVCAWRERKWRQTVFYRLVCMIRVAATEEERRRRVLRTAFHQPIA